MSDWLGYQLQDFIPFTADVYFRLFERMGETFWPLHLLTLAMGAAALVLALQQRTRLACCLLAPLWVFIGVAFFIQRYAELNWAGGYIGYTFIVQAVLLVVLALTGFGLGSLPHRPTVPAVIGAAIAIFGLVFLPLVAPLTGESWSQAQVLGIHADPTAITTLGLLLILLRGWALCVAAILPALWILTSALTLQALDASGAGMLFTVLASALLALVWKNLAPQPARTSDNPGPG